MGKRVGKNTDKKENSGMNKKLEKIGNMNPHSESNKSFTGIHIIELSPIHTLSLSLLF